MRTIYWNTEFDLGLRPRPRQMQRPRLVRQVRELSLQALVGVGRGDAVTARADVPPDYLDYLAACGLERPAVLPHPAVAAETRLEPFGWSAEAIEINRRHDRPAPHPTPACIRRANARSFALRLEHELGGGPPPGREVDGLEALTRLLADEGDGTEWVVKAEHGHAALANRRLRGGRLTPADRRFVRERLEEDDRLVVERWLPRELDATSVFEVPFDPTSFRLHQTINTGDGALIGTLFERDAEPLKPWRDALARAAERIAARLAAEGYFGPACVDALVWRDGGRRRLRPLVDLNARQPMSAPARRLWESRGARGALLYRFFNRRKLRLPARLGEAVAALGRRAYDAASGRGVLLASPLRVGLDGRRHPPGKLAVVFAGERREAVLELERWFRARFER